MGGAHFELTGENVTECIGGPQNLDDGDLHLNYTTYCDPRLNYAQSMEVSFRLAQLLRANMPSPSMSKGNEGLAVTPLASHVLSPRVKMPDVEI